MSRRSRRRRTKNWTTAIYGEPTKAVPERGKIEIFNRSYYEEVLVVRVHPELLEAQQLPQELMGKEIWEQRYADINNFEKYLARNGVVAS